MDKDAVKEAF